MIDIRTIHTFDNKSSDLVNTKKGTILIVDDNENILVTLNQLLKKEFEQIITTKKPDQIVDLMNSNQIDVILLDMNFKAGVNTGNEGFFWFKEVKRIDSDAIIVFITAYGDIDIAVRAMKEGADDFITKPWDTDKLVSTLHNLVELSQSKRKVQRLKILQKEVDDMFPLIIGESQPIKMVRETIAKIARTDATILVQGENGSGKALIAYEIHRQSTRKDEPFIHVDLGSLNENLFESELFGHVKGAFTDAKDDRIGRFEAASEGTLFLDEIGNLSLMLQQKLLAAVQNRTISRVGSNKVIKVNVRLICATNRNLVQLVKDGLFREDLYYRINLIQIESPPLRVRGSDIILLANCFLKEFAVKYKKRELKYTDQTLKRMQQYSWPGNIRELRHTIERAVLLSNGVDIRPEDLFAQKSEEIQEFQASNKLDDVERNTIIKVINLHKGNLTKAAEELGISRSTLYLKVEKYGI